MSYTKHLIGKLKQYRIANLLTYEELADRIGISTTALWHIIHGKSDPHETTVARIKIAVPELADRKQP